jgi:hypothetical protein
MRTFPIADPKSSYRNMRIIFFSMISGLILFTVVAVNIAGPKLVFNTDFSDPLLIPCLLVVVFSIPAGLFISGKALAKISPEETLSDRLNKYYQVLILRLATCEGPALFSVVCFLLTANMVYLMFGAIAFIVMLYHYPSLLKLQTELGMTEIETEELINRNV